MKKIVFGLCALFTMTLASCTREYTCECTITTITPSGSTEVIKSGTVSGRKKDAEAECEGQDSSVGDPTGTQVVTSCKIID